ncbi:MAG: hypothetical protein A2487_10570 [Candidatus Raymondbacteria bacterium RifOxyC12_full_50_8]|uniref:Outer membrane lipoprotein BamD-like domain-containing protein n=1 Tax=Candidatus Raymondbacteria bacterium RIFOXYD12_FULL_49_13 TaxID=1817890 RepID=A0A1F7F0T1_UNCRA|nr:MAG: hypothetical protein A2248_07860 [Candidatus Raymondbacteria bacterium RIFOXYA2_FULL_49_16]OGJ96580.1 MAG: hypothetical protein A2487_10570 [Candidatus Raymondbacteria bacterium RifOxyC12_full_50_8]OGK00259.1 MAG: hypothetical protein A2519_01235 [Candidatus Raymondbacteria bacterium RIFOXYD12_FULL_49_13]OGK02090.1 MAG: hypothetical protein A2350_21260 [Candidatus Raymondbacteria bacterium RifOxyB12_full_50_8]OGP42318.1 MAG: hypothetical protein A2324_20090 [Candidatus Raymondbacteria b
MKTHARALCCTLAACLFFFYGCGPRYTQMEPLVEDLIAEAKQEFDKGRFFQAKERFDQIKFDYPGNASIAEVQYYIGLCNFNLEDYLAAEQAFRIILNEFPADNPFADDALYYLCKTMYAETLPARLDQETTRKAIDEAEFFLETYPQSDLVPDIENIKQLCLDRLAEKEFLAGRLYRKMGYPSSAIHYFQLLEKTYPGSRWVARGRYEWARSFFMQKNFTDARNQADTCGQMIATLIEREKNNFTLEPKRSRASFVFHLFGFIPYDNRTDIKKYIDSLSADLSSLQAKIEKKMNKRAKSSAEKTSG